MKPHSRKFLDNSPSTDPSTVEPAAAVAPSSRSSKDYYNYPRPYLLPATGTSYGENDTLATRSQTAISALDSSMALTVVVLLAGLFFMGFFSVYINRLSDDNSPNDPRRRSQQSRRDSSSGLEPSTIQSLPLFAYDGNAKSKEPLDCPICLSEFEEKETVKVIPFCRHVFHPHCIDMWLSAHVSCPLCRSTQLLPPSSPPCDCKDDDPSSAAASGSVAMDEGSGHLSLIQIITDNQSSGLTGIEIECVECQRRDQQQRDEVPIPPSTGASATRKANGFSSSSSSSSIIEENRNRVYSLSLPRSSSF
ncbi:RING-H2 finger protein ATL11-like [Macadamia integrifolia]|uniref:RING-H2 finger protein ATL11-like n=1 Tax=Macadamia integrifolia TaxID=60698 RepID=UPI001C50029F|nr:RING-H2 finger protein ATL11-like [Macadamia integrifolia]